MSKPTLPTWDTNATNVAVGGITSGHKSDGLDTDEVPTSAEENTWRIMICAMLAWLSGRTTRTQHRFPDPYAQSSFAFDASVSGIDPALLSTGSSAYALIDLELDVGEQLDGLTFALDGNNTVDGTIVVEKHFTDGTSPSAVLTVVLTDVPSGWKDCYINLLAHQTTATVTVTVNGGGFGVYTRSTGSYLDEGFYVGMSGETITWAGFSHSGNNGSFQITALTATVMTTSNNSPVAEGPVSATVSAAATLATVDDTFSLVAKLTANAGGLAVKSMRVVSEVP